MRIRLIAFVLGAALLLGGCRHADGIGGNYREIEDMLLVQTLGVDTCGGGVRLTVCADQPAETAAPLLLSRGAESILQAMDASQDYAARGTLFFAHAREIVLGEDYAASGIAPLLDFAERDVQMRLETDLYVVRADTADALILGFGDENGGLPQRCPP